MKLLFNDYTAFENNNNGIFNSVRFGESINALEYILFNDNVAINNKMLKHKSLQALKDYNIWIHDNNVDLIKIKDDILKEKAKDP